MTILTLILGGAAAFVAFWAGTVSLIGFGGWKPLAVRYPAHHWPERGGTKMGMQSGRVGASNYNSALNAVVTPEGVYLRPIAVFKYNHPPIFIPWNAVESIEDGWLSGIKLTLAEGRLSLGGRLAKEVKRAYQAWQASAPGLDLSDGLLGPDGDTLSDEALQGSSWRRLRTR